MPSDQEKYFPSKYMKAGILDGPTILVVESVVEEEVGQGDDKDTVPMVRWVEDMKPLILNKTNFQMIAEIAGSASMKDWQGVAVELFVITGDFFGKTQEAIRVRAPKKAAAKTKAPKGVG